MVVAIIFDYARTIVNMDSEPHQLFPEAEAVLKELKSQGFKMALVSRGQDPDPRWVEFKELGLNDLFDVLDIVGPGGTKDFQHILLKVR